MSTARFTIGRTLVARLGHDEDLLAALTALAADEGVVVGAVQAIGALKEGRLAYYEQVRKEYREFAVPGPVEIVSCSGTVSQRDGAAAVHAHLCLADGDGRTTGGHLVAGCRIFACEAVVTELLGPALERGHDEITGLPLWMGM